MTRRLGARLAFVVTLVGVALVGPLSGAVGAQDNGRCDAGLFDKACELAKGAGDKIGSGVKSVVSAPVEAAGNSIMDQLTTWVAEAAVSLIGKIVSFMESSTTPRLTSSWFTDRYELMMGLALLVLLPLLLIAAIRALLHQDLSQLLKSFFLYVPVAILATFVAIHLTQMLLSITDDLSAAVSESVGGDATKFLEGGGSVASALGGVTGGFLMFFGALLVVIAGLLLWIQLLIRSAAIYVCVFFLPLVLAGLVWPATTRWTKRLIETLIALILSKFVIVAIISLAVAAMGRPLSESGGGGVGTVIGGASLLLLAAFSPFALFKLIPLAEASSIGHLEGMERRPGHALQGGGGGFSVQSFVRDKVASGRAAQGVGGASAGAGAGAATAATAGGAAAVMVAKKGATAPGRQLERQSEIVTPAGDSSSSKEDSGKGRGGSLRPPAPSSAKNKPV